MQTSRTSALALLTAVLAACSNGSSPAPGGPGGGGGGADTQKPTVTITTPDTSSTPNPTLALPLMIEGKLSDNVEVVRALIQIDNGPAQLLKFTPGADTSFSVTLSPNHVAAGQHTVVIQACDAANNCGEAQLRFMTGNGDGSGGTGGGNGGGGGGTVDTTRPGLVLMSPVSGATLGSSFNVIGNAWDDHGLSSVSASLDGGPSQQQTVSGASGAFTIGYQNVAPGPHTLVVTVTDASGNSTSSTVTFTVAASPGDTSQPTLTLTSPTNGAAVSNPVVISGSASDNALARVTYQVDGGAEQLITTSGGNFNALVTLDPGTHTITVHADDTSGNRSTSSVTVTVTNGSGSGDTVKPTLTVQTPGEGQLVLGSVTVSGTASDDQALAGVTVQLDGGTAQPATLTGGNYSLTLNSLSAGAHAIVVTARDSSGNTTTRSVNVTSVTPLVNGGSSSYSVTSGTYGLCLLCTVSGEGNVVNASLTDFARLTNAVGVTGGTSIRVKGPSLPAGQTVGFAVSAPSGDLLSLNVLSSLTLRTYLNGTPQESVAASSLLNLSALGLLGGGGPSLYGLSMTTTKPFDSVQLDNGAAVGVLSGLNVYFAFIR